MVRSVWKGPFVEEGLLKACNGGKKGITERLETRSRASTILPVMVGKTIHVYNGKVFIPVAINEYMIGMKLGEFSPTRTFRGHAGDKRVVRTSKV